MSTAGSHLHVNELYNYYYAKKYLILFVLLIRLIVHTCGFNSVVNETRAQLMKLNHLDKLMQIQVGYLTYKLDYNSFYNFRIL